MVKADIVDRLNDLPHLARRDADFQDMRAVCDDAIAEIEAMQIALISLTRAIEREGFTVFVEIDKGKFTLERRKP